MRRVTVNIDAEALREAQRILGAPTLTETVNRSLGEVVRRHRLPRLRSRRLPALTPEVLEAMRRSRLP